SAMAAAALVELAGGGADLALEAAAVALQNTLGLICDPVGCLVEVPCITRNAMAVGNAFAVADLILGGYRQGIPVDEVVDAMAAVARAMPSAHRCTGLGGVADTATGRRLASGLPDR
ncbi:MAG TPA: L-serine ammonia-lyase, iron-sulfur-dependent, subunit alpha, partial [Symbiobacteriaceae bacterium]|nr:L-serine ammonia-lyase, iron-sulfur-dependent, subunit alpha [Symbiobacteriaceae bacterium]